MDLGLSNKVTLITGSTSGLGLAIARLMSREGSRVVINGRDVARLAQARESIPGESEGLVADVTDVEQARRLVRHVLECYGRLDILVCNVGSGRSMPPGKETSQEWERVLRTNLLSATNVIECARPVMAHQGGSIVCISSICGLEALGAPLTYSAAKSALNAYVRGAARPLAAEGIRINAVAPGNMLFPGSTWEKKVLDDPVGVQAMLERDVALKRLGAPEEVAVFVAFVASPVACFATGSVFVVDGGQVRS